MGIVIKGNNYNIFLRFTLKNNVLVDYLKIVNEIKT